MYPLGACKIVPSRLLDLLSRLYFLCFSIISGFSSADRNILWNVTFTLHFTLHWKNTSELEKWLIWIFCEALKKNVFRTKVLVCSARPVSHFIFQRPFERLEKSAEQICFEHFSRNWLTLGKQGLRRKLVLCLLSEMDRSACLNGKDITKLKAKIHIQVNVEKINMGHLGEISRLWNALFRVDL